jgi:hypothetical protein
MEIREMQSISTSSSAPPPVHALAASPPAVPPRDADGDHDGSKGPDAAKPPGVGGLLDTKA